MNMKPDGLSMGFEKAVQDQLALRQKTEEYLSQFESRVATISAEELAAIIKVTQDLAKLKQAAETGRVKVPPEKALGILIDFLDSKSLWSAKFSTSHDENNERNPEKDSLYYLTPSGLSLRVKVANLAEKGFAAVIQPFMETIYFESPDGRDLSENPKLGYTTMEYVSDDFLYLQEQDKSSGPYNSPIKKYYDNTGKLMGVEPSQGAKSHNGHAVNHIFNLESAEVSPPSKL